MWESVEPKLREIAKRAGLGSAPTSVIVVALLLCVFACGWAVWRWWPAQPSLPSATGQVVESVLPSAPADVAPANEVTSLIVHVAGAVFRPGVFQLTAGARVVDAVEAAGGALPDAVLDGVNLARPLTDGEQIIVPDKESYSAPAVSAGALAGGGGGAAGAKGGPLINVNTADQTALQTLPGIGPATATKIVADREANGPYATADDLRRVSGIGEKKLEAIRDLVTVR